MILREDFSPDLPGPVVNVADFGAVARQADQPLVDSTDAIERAFAAAFSRENHPHPIFFPAGGYRITRSIRISNVRGARIFGAHAQCGVQYEGQNTTPEQGGIIPALWCDGVSSLVMQHISWVHRPGGVPPFSGLVPIVGSIYTAGIWFDSARYPCIGNLVKQCGFSSSGLAGVAHTSGAHVNTGTTYLRCDLHNNTTAYLFRGANTFGHRIYCGGWGHNGHIFPSGGRGSGAVRVDDGAGSILFHGMGTVENFPEVSAFGAGGPVTVIGTTPESRLAVNTDSQVNIVRSGYRWGTSVGIGTARGTTLTLKGMSYQHHRGMLVFGGDGTNMYRHDHEQRDPDYLGTVIVRQIAPAPGFGWERDGDYETNFSADPGDFTDAPVAVSPVLGSVWDGGRLNLDGVVNREYVLAGTPGARVAMNFYNPDQGIGAGAARRENFWAAFRGKLSSLSLAPRRLPYADLTTWFPPRVCPGMQVVVVDSNIPAAGNQGAIPGGGGTNVVPCYSDGTDWRIG